MTALRLFLDTSFVQALVNSDDQHHEQASEIFPTLPHAEVWTTEAVLVEIGNALSRNDRDAAVTSIRQYYRAPNVRVVSVDTSLLMRALDLYEQRRDKTWG